MKKILAVAVGVFFAASLMVQAEDPKPKKEIKHEKKSVMGEMLEKYDTNKDGKLDKAERAKMTAEDKEKLAKTNATVKKKAADAAAPAASATPGTPATPAAPANR